MRVLVSFIIGRMSLQYQHLPTFIIMRHSVEVLILKSDIPCVFSLVKMVFNVAKSSKRVPNWHEIEHAIRRNFSGLEVEDFDPVHIFMDHLGVPQDYGQVGQRGIFCVIILVFLPHERLVIMSIFSNSQGSREDKGLTSFDLIRDSLQRNNVEG